MNSPALKSSFRHLLAALLAGFILPSCSTTLTEPPPSARRITVEAHVKGKPPVSYEIAANWVRATMKKPGQPPVVVTGRNMDEVSLKLKAAGY